MGAALKIMPPLMRAFIFIAFSAINEIRRPWGIQSPWEGPHGKPKNPIWEGKPQEPRDPQNLGATPPWEPQGTTHGRENQIDQNAYKVWAPNPSSAAAP